MPKPLNRCDFIRPVQATSGARRTKDYKFAKSRASTLGASERGYPVALHFAEVIADRRRETKITIAEVFSDRANRWHQETDILSSIQAKIFHRDYQEIIGMGKPALPFIFADLRDRGGPWYWALECICRLNPAEGAKTLPEAKKMWLDYAADNNFI